MSMSRTEAAAALRAVDETQAASSRLQSYRRAAPYFELWGFVWMLGYGCNWLLPQYATPTWFVLVAAGALGQTLLVRRAATGDHDPARGRGIAWRAGALCALLMGFFVGIQLLFRPVSPAAIGALAPLCCGFAYAGVGLWFGLRFLVTGLVIIAVALVGVLYLPGQFALWMALCGGGALVLTGQWLRRA